jgi:hypothetical protein
MFGQGKIWEPCSRVSLRSNSFRKRENRSEIRTLPTQAYPETGHGLEVTQLGLEKNRCKEKSTKYQARKLSTSFSLLVPIFFLQTYLVTLLVGKVPLSEKNAN